MNNFEETEHTQLSVTDFGPIKEAKIELRPLTVFIGPNNTGKSFLSTLIYALHKNFENYESYRTKLPQRAVFSNSAVKWENLTSPSLDLNKIQLFYHWVNETLLKQHDDSDVPLLRIPDFITDLLKHVLDEFGEKIFEEMRRCFGVSNPSKLIRRAAKNGVQIVWSNNQNTKTNADNILRYSFSMVESRQVYSHKFADADQTQTSLFLNRNSKLRNYVERMIKDIDVSLLNPESPKIFESKSLSSINQLLVFILSNALNQAAGHFRNRAYYLPANRTGIIHAHRLVVSSLIERATSVGLMENAQVPLLSGITSDFLQRLIESSTENKVSEGKIEDLTERIESEILGGSIRSKPSSVGYPTFLYKPAGWRESVDLANTSSMVSELAPLVLYLRHVIQPGDVLIFEEPESHLHPAMQARLAREIVKLVNSKVHVIVKTHSDYLLEQFANSIRLSELDETQIKEMNVGEAIHPSQFGAWLFKLENSPIDGSVVEEARFDEDAGGLDPGYFEVAAQLHNTWADIGSRIANRDESQNE